MRYREIYCFDCNKTLGQYNEKFYSDDKLSEIIIYVHKICIQQGHRVVIKRKEHQNPN